MPRRPSKGGGAQCKRDLVITEATQVVALEVKMGQAREVPRTLQKNQLKIILILLFFLLRCGFSLFLRASFDFVEFAHFVY